MIKRIVFLFLSVFVVSCGEKVRDPMDRFSKTIDIHARKLNVDTYKFSSAGRMILFEEQGCLVKENWKGESLIDQIFYKKDSVHSLGKLGDGPEDFLYPSLMQKKDNTSILILEKQKGSVVTKNIEPNNYTELKLDCYPSKLLQTNEGFIAVGANSWQDVDKRYRLLDLYGASIYSFGDLPSDQIDIPLRNKQIAYQCHMVYHSTLNRFASICCFGAIFEIYQLGENPQLVKQYHDVFPAYQNGSDDPKVAGVIYRMEENIEGGQDLYATDRYIYALYSGKKHKDRTPEALQDAQLTPYILVYDWDGNCVCRLKADHPLFNICVTADDSRLIALGWEDDFLLYEFDLPSF